MALLIALAAGLALLAMRKPPAKQQGELPPEDLATIMTALATDDPKVLSAEASNQAGKGHQLAANGLAMAASDARKS